MLPDIISDPRATRIAGGLADTYRGGIDVAKGTCSVDECGREVVALGWCRLHYNRVYRKGEPGSVQPRRKQTAIERFEKRVNRGVGCWLWNSMTNRDGYGSFWSGEHRVRNGNRFPVMVLAHRWAYQHFVGPIPDGLYVLHECDNPGCVNPEHLVLGTQADNVRDCAEKGRRNQVRPKRPKRACSVEGCDGVAISRDWCMKHYTRWYKHGDVNASGRSSP